MKRVLVIFILFLSVFSCRKFEPSVPLPERELSVPEKVEKTLVDILSKDWKSLADTLEYFGSNMLLNGKSRGIAPDGVYYELSVHLIGNYNVEAIFKVQDSIWAVVRGQIDPLEATLDAYDTEILIKKEKNDSTSLSVPNVKVILPHSFLFEKGHEASLLYDGKRAGYLTLDEFEDTDYSAITCLVVHYYNDSRTFALMDNGFYKLLIISLEDAFK